ncbi:MAG TPA: hypothetical protein VGJ21_15295 [Terracidiphilus sp.]
MAKFRGWAAVACLCCGLLAEAQANAPAGDKAATEPALTPGALYKQALQPLDLVRSSMDNWSDSEMGAFAVGMRTAKAACDQSSPQNYQGDDLYDLARLCSLGQDWNAANTAATRYLDSRLEPHRTEAFALSINALMHLDGSDLAVATANSMMENQPYDAEEAYAIRYLKGALEQVGNANAVPLAETEHPRIVKALEAGSALRSAHGDAVMSPGALYESAMDMAFWQRYGHSDVAAAATTSDIEQALAKTPTLAAEDKLRVDAIRTQYALLGQPLPDLKTAPVAEPPKTKGKTAVAPPAPRIGPDYGAATVLVLFPDWCPQCRRMMKALTEFATANKDTPIYAYGLMFLDDPAAQNLTEEKKTAAHEQNIKDVEGTSTMLVDVNAPQTLGALDFPLGIVLDHDGRVRFVGVLPGDAFAGNGYMEKVLVRMTGAEASAPTPK